MLSGVWLKHIHKKAAQLKNANSLIRTHFFGWFLFYAHYHIFDKTRQDNNPSNHHNNSILIFGVHNIRTAVLQQYGFDHCNMLLFYCGHEFECEDYEWSDHGYENIDLWLVYWSVAESWSQTCDCEVKYSESPVPGDDTKWPMTPNNI